MEDAAGGTHALMHHHPIFSIKISRVFEECTGAKAAVSYIKNVDAALISPFGVAYMPITMVIEKLLDRSCQKDVEASARGRREFWTFEDIRQEELSSSLGFWERSKRSDSPKAAAKFVGDFLLGPIYNVCRFLGKLGTSFVSNPTSPYASPSNTFNQLARSRPCD